MEIIIDGAENQTRTSKEIMQRKNVDARFTVHEKHDRQLCKEVQTDEVDVTITCQSIELCILYEYRCELQA